MKSTAVLLILQLFFLSTMTAEVPENAMERIKALRKEIKDYCACQMHIRYLFQADALQLDLYLKKKEDKGKVDEIVEKYRNLFARLDVHLPPRDPDEHIKKFDSDRYQQLLAEYLKNIIAQLEKEKLDDIYVFAVSLNTDTSSVSVDWNTSEGFEQIKRKYREKWPEKYKDDNDFEGFQFNPPEFFYSDAGFANDHASEVFEILADFDESIYRAYEDHGDGYLTGISNRYSFLLVESTIRALKSVSEEFERLETAKGFVYFVQPFDLPAEVQVIAAERTVSAGQVKEIYPYWFKK